MGRISSIVIACLCLAAGCGSADDSLKPTDPTDGHAGSGASESALDVQFDELAFGVERPLGHRLRLALVRPGSYRPVEVTLTDQAAVIVSDLLYDGLTEAVGNDRRLRPGLASQWSASENFTVWTFLLDPQSGVTAQQVVSGFAPFAAGTGARFDRAGAAAVVAADIESVSAGDELTVVVRLGAPNAGLPWVLSGLPYSITGPKGAATGDFEITSDDTNGMILQRRRQPSPEPGSVPRSGPDEIQIMWSDTGGAAYDRLRAGEVDAAVVDPPSFADARTRFDAEQTATVATRFYVMNSRSATLAESSVRRAVLAAIDRSELVEVGFGPQVVEIDGLLGPTVVGYDDASSCGPVCDHDPRLAAQVVADMDVPMLKVSFTGHDQENLASAIERQLSAAGLKTQHSGLPPEDLASVIVSGETDLFAFGWVAPATSSDAVIPPLLTVDSEANIARVDSKIVMELLAEASVTADDDSRWAILAEAHRAALAEALIMPIAASTSMLVKAPQARGLSVRADGSIDLDSTG